MANDYDKIFKENIEELVLPLAAKFLNIIPRELEEIPDDLQQTIERKPDFLKRVIQKEKKEPLILQIEFQTSNDQQMEFRMLEYKSMLLRSYQLQVQQYVFYLGKAPLRMKNVLEDDQLSFSYSLIDLSQISYQEFIYSEKPEELILAILADFKKKSPQEVIRQLLIQLKSLNLETLSVGKYVKQLEILSNLRDLQKDIVKLIPTIMPLEYDLKKDIRFKQGIEQGIERSILAFLKQGKLSKQEIADALNVELSYVNDLAQKLKNDE